MCTPFLSDFPVFYTFRLHILTPNMVVACTIAKMCLSKSSTTMKSYALCRLTCGEQRQSRST